MTEFYEFTKGNIPILFLALHGGQFLKLENTSELCDLYTDTLGYKIVDHWKNLTDRQEYPSLLVVQVHKSVMNGNRSLEEQHSDFGRILWHEVHNLIQKEKETNENLLIIDLHGYMSDYNIIYRGTRNGSSFKANARWVSKWNEYMSSFVIVPSSWDTYKGENSKYIGGYNTKTYKNCIQLELPLQIRKDPTDFIVSFVNFLRNYIK